MAQNDQDAAVDSAKHPSEAQSTQRGSEDGEAAAGTDAGTRSTCSVLSVGSSSGLLLAIETHQEERVVPRVRVIDEVKETLVGGGVG